MFCLCLGLPCVFRQGFRAVLFCQNQSGGFRYGESECGGKQPVVNHRVGGLEGRRRLKISRGIVNHRVGGLEEKN